ncbi:hypothetical protein B0I35DRAFT_455181 [Stachybotrys elegans]|uniref:Calcineurin-like phosphoesterase domain-containing protein n=1 Tax=Stachybotrys elegans TaxID=80388 RepID=A0A8K0WJY8_9HYPO|nr:hypothetical protein B0I35DRAFT_455181 [Stachybotrys elegans]
MTGSAFLPDSEKPPIKTRVLILSDTNGKRFERDKIFQGHVDIAIHCGNLTDGSKLEEFGAAIELLKAIKATWKFVIAGSRDFTLDDGAFEKIKAEADRGEVTLGGSIAEEYGLVGEARLILLDIVRHGIKYLREGTHQVILHNDALVRIYASPYTPSNGSTGGFQYTDGHEFCIPPGTDIVVTHGPPRGVWDRIRDPRQAGSEERIGCPQLFGAVARAQPRLHCFGHARGDWGARLVTWRREISEHPSHLADIDNEGGKSPVIASLPWMPGDKLKACREGNCYYTNHCTGDENAVGEGKTLFINAALVRDDDGPERFPWLVEIDLSQVWRPEPSADMVEL